MKSFAVLVLIASLTTAAEPPTAPARKWELPAPAKSATALAWLPDGNFVAADESGIVRVWDAATHRETAQLPALERSSSKRIIALAVNRSGTTIAIAHKTLGLRVWDRKTDRDRLVKLETIFPLTYDKSHVSDVAYLDNSDKLGILSSQAELAQIDRDGQTLGPSILMPLVFGRGEKAFYRDETEAAVAIPAQLGLAYYEGHEVDELRLWDFAKNRLAASTTLRDLARPQVLAIASDGRRAILRNLRPGTPPELLLFDVAALKEVGSFVLPKHRPGGTVHSNFSPDGRLVFVSYFDNPILVLDAARLTPIAQLTAGHVSCSSFSHDNRNVATGHADARVSIHDLRAAVDPNPPKALDAAACWSDLGSSEGAIGMRAVWRFADHPAAAVKFIQEKLKPASKPNADDVAKWIKSLDAPAFAERQAATKKLAAAADTIGPDLEQAAKASASTETAQAIQTLIENAARSRRKLEGHALLAYRAVQVLESVGPPGIAVLKAYAAGAPGAFLTNEARTALGRLN